MGVAEVPQHMQALALANEAKRGHTALKREVRSGALSVAVALKDVRATGNLTLGKLLAAQTRWGSTRTRRFCLSLGIPENKRVDQLTERQRTLVGERVPTKVAAHHKRRSLESR